MVLGSLSLTGAAAADATGFSNITVPRLANLTRDLTISLAGPDGQASVAVMFPTLEAVGGHVVVSQTRGLGSLSLPRLRGVEGAVAIRDNNDLTSASLAALAAVGSNLKILGNDVLQSVRLAGLLHVGQNVQIWGNDQLAAGWLRQLCGLVNAPSHSCCVNVAGSVTQTGGECGPTASTAVEPTTTATASASATPVKGGSAGATPTPGTFATRGSAQRTTHGPHSPAKIRVTTYTAGSDCDSTGVGEVATYTTLPACVKTSGAGAGGSIYLVGCDGNGAMQHTTDCNADCTECGTPRRTLHLDTCAPTSAGGPLFAVDALEGDHCLNTVPAVPANTSALPPCICPGFGASLACTSSVYSDQCSPPTSDTKCPKSGEQLCRVAKHKIVWRQSTGAAHATPQRFLLKPPTLKWGTPQADLADPASGARYLSTCHAQLGVGGDVAAGVHCGGGVADFVDMLDQNNGRDVVFSSEPVGADAFLVCATHRGKSELQVRAVDEDNGDQCDQSTRQQPAVPTAPATFSCVKNTAEVTAAAGHRSIGKHFIERCSTYCHVAVTRHNTTAAGYTIEQGCAPASAAADDGRAGSCTRTTAFASCQETATPQGLKGECCCRHDHCNGFKAIAFQCSVEDQLADACRQDSQPLPYRRRYNLPGAADRVNGMRSKCYVQQSPCQGRGFTHPSPCALWKQRGQCGAGAQRQEACPAECGPPASCDNAPHEFAQLKAKEVIYATYQGITSVKLHAAVAPPTRGGASARMDLWMQGVDYSSKACMSNASQPGASLNSLCTCREIPSACQDALSFCVPVPEIELPAVGLVDVSSLVPLPEKTRNDVALLDRLVQPGITQDAALLIVGQFQSVPCSEQDGGNVTNSTTAMGCIVDVLSWLLALQGQGGAGDVAALDGVAVPRLVEALGASPVLFAAPTSQGVASSIVDVASAGVRVSVMRWGERQFRGLVWPPQENGTQFGVKVAVGDAEGPAAPSGVTVVVPAEAGILATTGVSATTLPRTGGDAGGPSAPGTTARATDEFGFGPLGADDSAVEGPRDRRGANSSQADDIAIANANANANATASTRATSAPVTLRDAVVAPAPPSTNTATSSGVRIAVAVYSRAASANVFAAGNSSVLASTVVSVQLFHENTPQHRLAANVSHVFEVTGPFDPRTQEVECAWWDFNAPAVDGSPATSASGAWDSFGCSAVVPLTHTQGHVTRRDEGLALAAVECTCNHLCHFGVLFRPRKAEENGQRSGDPNAVVLRVITYAGMAASVVCLVLTVVVYTCLRDLWTNEATRRHNYILINFALALVFLQITFAFAAPGAHTSAESCSVVAGLLHYMSLVSWAWMVTEGYHLYVAPLVVLTTVSCAHVSTPARQHQPVAFATVRRAHFGGVVLKGR